MDSYAAGGTGAAVIVAIGIIVRLIGMINHHRIKSECMGKKFTASIDIQPTTPEKNTSTEKNGRESEDGVARDGL
jgi:hypothetical protein